MIPLFASDPSSEIIFIDISWLETAFFFHDTARIYGSDAIFKDFSRFGAVTDVFFSDISQFSSPNDAFFNDFSTFEILPDDFLFQDLSRMGRPAGIWRTVGSRAFRVFMNGADITGKIVSASISEEITAIHKQITCQSISKKLYLEVKNALENGGINIKVELGSRIINFHGEKLRGNEFSWSLWGRDISAVLYPEQKFHQNEVKTLASSLAGQFITGIDWQIHDWLLPKEFIAQGTDIDIVNSIVSVVGGVLNAEDDGMLAAKREYYPRPVHLNDDDAVVHYDETNIMTLSLDKNQGTGENSVEVVGYLSSESFDFSVELDGTSEYIGDDVGIRIFWKSEKKPELYADTTDGKIYYIGPKTETSVEELTFIQNKASVQKPIRNLVSIEWISEPSEISWERYSQEIFCESKYAVGIVTYEYEYERYRLSEHIDPTIIVSFGTNDATGVDLIVRINNDEEDLEADPISENNITDRQGAIERGMAYLDANRYDKHVASIKVPYYNEALPGKITYINDVGCEIFGPAYIRKQTINVSMPEISVAMEIEQCQV